MPSSITYWNRLEPRPRAVDLGEALAARAYDPAWLLARQWQLGEFQGEDAGAPAYVRVSTSTAPLTAWGEAGGAPSALHPVAPLEASLTAEPPSPDDLARAVEIGQTFERLLTDAGAAHLRPLFVAAYPIPDATEEDPRAARLRALWRDRAIDGQALWAAIQLPVPPPPPGVDLTPPPVPGVPWTVGAVWRGQAAAAVASLITWIERGLGGPRHGTPPGWQTETLSAKPAAYSAVSGVVPDAFTVNPDRRGDLDWFAFDRRTDAPPPAIPTGGAVKQVCAVIPGPVRFRGMPNERFWDFEDARFPIDAIRPDRRNLASMLLLDFMLVHGNDWYLVPFEQPCGSLCASEVTVVDVFGEATDVPRAESGAVGNGRFAMFAITDDSAALAPFHLVPRSCAASVQEGPPIEEVRFLRDEMANLVWAVEHTTQGTLGGGRRAADRPIAPTPSEAPLPPGAVLRYRLQSPVPRHWFPLQPVKLPAGHEVALELAGLLTADAATPTVPSPAGRILATDGATPLRVREEQVPREGTHVRRGYRRARGADGSTYVWLARTRRTGTGEGSADLRFDRAVDAPPPVGT
jgi:hypothetical protein